ncbi:hypothetical protein K439DRAFT_176278 [Ramaria rubella]|nr:hypothetical protein K439DRAFT_176278 [Ramaria rubella]
MERKFCEQLRGSQSMPPAVYRQGEHFTPVPELSPPVGLCIPRVRSNIPKEKRWLAFVKDWEEPDVTRGLIIPLKDWNPKWKTDLNFAMSYTARRVIATEFIDNCGRREDIFVQRWPAAMNGTTELCKAIQAAHIREGTAKARRSKNGSPEERCHGAENTVQGNDAGVRSRKRRKITVIARERPVVKRMGK